MNQILAIVAGAVLSLALGYAHAAAPLAPSESSVRAQGILFENVKVFNGTSTSLSELTNVLIVGNVIHSIATTSMEQPADVEVTRISGEGRTLIPGLIDAHTHLMLATLSILRSPYPGKLGVVEAGALADLLLVDGDPLQDINLVADPAKNFVVIMKDGKVYKNSLTQSGDTYL